GFTSVVVGTLALGIGGTAAVFSVVQAVLLEPLPWDRPDQLVRLYQFDEEDPATNLYVSAPHFLSYRDQASAFQDLVAVYTYEEVGADLRVGDHSERIRLLRVSSGYLALLGRAPVAGRGFTLEEESGPPVVLVSEGLRERLGREETAPGSSLELDGTRYTVVGIMPGDLEDPLAGAVDAWLPLDLHGGGAQYPGNHYLSVLGRLADGVSSSRAREEMGALDRALGERWPDVADDGGFHLVPLHDDLVGQARPTLLLLLGAVAFVLLIACVNVANLQMARALGRRGELAVRSALGGGRAALTRQLLVENLLLALAGGALGLGVAVLGVDTLVSLAGDAIPRSRTVAIDGAVLAFTAAVTLLTGIGFGLAPSLALSRTSPAETLREAAAGGAGGRRHARWRSALVAGQVALTLMLLVGASVLATSLHRLTRVDLGFEPTGVLTFELNLPAGRYDPEARDAFHREMTARLDGATGVDAVGATSWLPATDRAYGWGTRPLTGPRAGEDGALLDADQRIVEGQFFEALDIPLLEGRLFDSQDDADGPAVAVVSREVAQTLFPGTSALGQRIRMGGVERDIIGVVGEVAVRPDGSTVPTVYHRHSQYADRLWQLTYLVATSGDPMAVLPTLRREVTGRDPLLVVHRPAPLTEILGGGRARPRFASVLSASFAGLAVVLAVLGLYGMLAYAVRQRRREIGIRLALGAGARGVAAMVVGHGMLVTAVGITLGLVGSLSLGRVLAAFVFRTDPADPWILVAATAGLVAVAVAAAAIPALRATRVPPRATLVAE
ncbi:MAG: ABC transporter permease, partial [Gemmatimonadota bacterium]